MTFDLWFEMLYESSEAKGVSTIAVGKKRSEWNGPVVPGGTLVPYFTNNPP